MNAHDTERIAGLLLDAGYEQALVGSEPDLIPALSAKMLITNSMEISPS